MARAADDRKLCLRRAEYRTLDRDRDVRAGRIAQAAARAVAMHRADQRHAQLVQRERTVVIYLLRIGNVLVINAFLKRLMSTPTKRLEVGMHDAHPYIVIMVDIIAQHDDLFLHRAAGRVDRRVVQR